MEKGSGIEPGSMDANILETDLGNPEQEHWDEQQQGSKQDIEDDKREKEEAEEEKRKYWNGQEQVSKKH